MGNEKMTIFYKKRTLEMCGACQGEQTLRFLGDDEEDMALIYGLIIVDYDAFVFTNRRGFELIQDENGKIIIKMRDEFKESFMKYISA